MPSTLRHPVFARSLLALGLMLLTVPVLFETFHAAVAPWTLRDDYAPLLLHLLGEPGGDPMTAPMGYRWLAILPAAIPYELFPLYRLSHGQEQPEQWLRATQSLLLVSWAASALLATTVFSHCRDHLRCDPAPSAVAALAALLCLRFTSTIGTDPIGILGVAVALYALDRRWLFAVLMLGSVLLNEKIAFLFTFVLAGRAVILPDKRLPQLGAAGLAALAHVALRLLGPLEGSEGQLEVTGFASQALATVRADFTPNGLARSLLPSAVVFLGFGVGHALSGGTQRRLLHPVDAVGALGLFAIAHLAATNVGRVVMFAIPFFVPLLAMGLQASRSASTTTPESPG